MSRLLLLLIFSCSALYLTAQEKISSDSISIIPNEIKVGQPVIERSLNFNETTFPEEITFPDISIFNQPLLPDYNKNLDFSRHLNPKQISFSAPYSAGFSNHSIFSFGHVFNQSAYQLNDRLTFGGNSFGARSIFEAPKLNSSIQDLSIKGASMFMEYKVTDKFKVQTRVSISNRNSSPWDY